MMQNKTKIIGITGGVGSGKSEIMKFLENEFQGKVIIADQVAHRLMEPGNVNYEAIIKNFGKGILHIDGTIDRKALGDIVFHKKEKLELLNQITHKNVDDEIVRQINEAKGKVPLIVCEAALLIGANYEKMFDELWYIYVNKEVRGIRLKQSRGYSDEKIESIMKNQSSEEEFLKMADVVIDNSCTLEETKKVVKKHINLWYNVR